MINLVIAYSQQKNNRCVIGDSEQDHMSVIANELYNILKADNRFNLYLMPKLNVGSDLDNLRKSIALSNEFINKNGGQGYHLELHSDAGYSASGVSGLYKTTAGKLFIAPIVQELMNLTPWDDIGLKQRTDLGALNQTKAVAGLIEVSFHDKQNEAKWIHENSKEIAKAIATGLYKSLGISPLPNGIKIKVNGKFIDTDVEPFIKDGRVMVPVRFVVEALGKKVDWDSKNQIVDIK